MHLPTMHAPVRNAIVSTRLSSVVLPIPSLQQQRRYRASSPSSSSPTHSPRKAASHLPRLCAQHRRYASTSSAFPSETSSSASTTSSTHAGPNNQASNLDWNSFFRLRTSRRRYNLVSSITTSLTTTFAGVSVLSTQNVDSLGTQIFGLDPFVVLGLATAGFGALGWLMGPFLGGGLWSWLHQGQRTAFANKEKQFYNRIKRFRVDPSLNSFQNPVPDYYGEKIGSVTGYRHWLKDQRAFNRKRKTL